jgi:plastocyanin
MYRTLKQIIGSAAISAALIVSGCQSARMGGSAGGDPAFLRGDADPRAEATKASQQTAAPTKIAEQTQKVAIDNFSFSPAEVTIPAGSTVVWVNRDDVPHTVVSNTKTFSSKALDTDDQYSHVFATAGTYPYYCSVHPHMTGQIIVK